MRVVAMTYEERRSQMLCHRCWLVGEQVLAAKMIDKQGGLLLKEYEDVILKDIRLGICETCLMRLDLVKNGRGDMHGEE